jgi:hypothetical protein
MVLARFGNVGGLLLDDFEDGGARFQRLVLGRARRRLHE